MRASKVLIHVQHLMGIGHQRRMAAIARALMDCGVDVTYVSGGLPVSNLDISGAGFVQLPPAQVRGGDYSVLVDEYGSPLDEHWRAARREQLLSVFIACQPDCLLIETFPFGRKLLEFELLPLLTLVKGLVAPPLVVCSLRDIIERRENLARYERMSACALASFDRVLVHSDPHVVSLGDSFPDIRRIEHLVVHTGFVSASPALPGERAAGRDIVVSVSGGAVGQRLLDTAIAAAARDLVPGCRWHLLVGDGLPEEAFAALRSAAGANTLVERHRSDFRSLLRDARAAVTQAGYNTLLDIVQADVPAVLVPYAQGGEMEQTTRARLFAEILPIKVLAEDALSSDNLAGSLVTVMNRPTDGDVALRLDGATSSAHNIVHWLAQRHQQAG